MIYPTMISMITSAVPATWQGYEKGVCHLGYMDLLMKLHYIKAIYFFTAEAVQCLSTHDLEKPMYTLLDLLPHLSGRIWISGSDRPVIKCNDAGLRIIESHCDDHTLEEWYYGNRNSFEGLVYDNVLGPDLKFSPLIFVKFTWFKCGGLCIGLNWSHVLGDAFSAFNFITMWSQALAGHILPKSLPLPNPKETHEHNSVSGNPISMKRATIVGKQWLATNNTKVVTHSFYITFKQLDQLTTSTFSYGEIQTTKISSFEILSALVWKYISCIRKEYGPKVVTICKYGIDRRENEFPSNGLVLSRVEANVAVSKCDVAHLARLIVKEKMVENHVMEKLMEENEGKGDFIVYGANLTFVDLEEANIYGVQLNGKKPLLANCTFHGVGDQGIVLVIPAPKDNESGNSGRMITISLPEKELDQLKDKLEGEWGISSYPL